MRLINQRSTEPTYFLGYQRAGYCVASKSSRQEAWNHRPGCPVSPRIISSTKCPCRTTCLTLTRMPMTTLLLKGLAAPAPRSKLTCVPRPSAWPSLPDWTDRCRDRAEKAMSATLPLAILPLVTINPPTPCRLHLQSLTFATRMADDITLMPRASIQFRMTMCAQLYSVANDIIADSISIGRGGSARSPAPRLSSHTRRQAVQSTNS